MEARQHGDMKALLWTRDSPLTKRFVRLFYGIMNTFPEYLHQFYGDRSRIVFSEFGPSTPPRTQSADTRKNIREIQKAYFKDVTIVVKTAIPQISVEEGVLLLVSGTYTKKSVDSKAEEDHFFTQALMLAPQEHGYYVLTDTLHIMLKSDGSSEIPFSWAEERQQNSEQQPYCFYPQIKTCPPRSGTSRASKQDETPAIVTTTPLAGPPSTRSDLNDGCRNDDKPSEITSCKMKSNEKEDQEHSNDSDTDTKTEEDEPTKKQSAQMITNDDMHHSNGNNNNVHGHSTSGHGSGGDGGNGNLVVGKNFVNLACPNHKFNPAQPRLTTSARLDGLMNAGGRLPGSTPLRVGIGVPPAQPLKPRNPTTTVIGVGTNEGRMMAIPPGQGVFIARLPFGIQAEEVVKAFSIFGPILNGADGIQVRDGRNGCYAFVTFESVASAQAAIQNGAIVHGKRVFVEPRNPPAETTTDAGYTPLPVAMQTPCVLPMRFPAVPTMVPYRRRRAN